MIPLVPDRQTVLIVDDTPDNLTLLSGLLKDRYRVRIANGGARALAIAGTHPVPDLILLDVMMPEIDGYEVCRRLKADPVTADIPVVFLTARTQVEDEEKGFAAGAVDYITKPVSPPIVQARVATHLSLRHASRLLADRNAHLAALVEEDGERRPAHRLADGLDDGASRRDLLALGAAGPEDRLALLLV